MQEIKNKFGSGIMYDMQDIEFCDAYVVCVACMSVWSDFLSYANSVYCNVHIHSYFDKSFKNGKAIVILGCQVTDLAIYNDLKTAEELHEKYPDIPIYMGGCLAYRFDIELPSYINRMSVAREEYQEIYDRFMIDYRKPFWNKTLMNNADEFETGNLFRNYYHPIKIGAGCHGKCKYCTIRDTRGDSYETDAYLQVQEFLNHNNVVLISDSPTVKQVQDWCHIAMRYNKPISMRNVEPQVAMACTKELLDLSDKGLLKIFHCPIQSNDPNVLKAMNKNVGITLDYIEWVQELRKRGTKVATNIIIDYVVNGDVVHNMPEDWLNAHFDYWSWNPYFDGKWDHNKAKERFEKYIGGWSI